MTLLPLTDCCLLLGVDPKTLRLWLKSANLSWTLHPSDARLKCLTQPQLDHLATLHGRFLPESPPSTPSTASPRRTPRFQGLRTKAALSSCRLWLWIRPPARSSCPGTMPATMPRAAAWPRTSP